MLIKQRGRKSKLTFKGNHINRSVVQGIMGSATLPTQEVLLVIKHLRVFSIYGLTLSIWPFNKGLKTGDVEKIILPIKLW